MKRTKTLATSISFLSLLPLLVPTALAKEKFAHAVERSQHAGRIVASLALLPDTGFPKELMDKAEAVAVFPKVKQETAMFTKTTQGYGVISSRTANGWTLPSFYQFAGGSFGNPFAQSENFGVILLFMTPDAVAAFEKGGVDLAGERKALAGPLGNITAEQRKELEGAHILAYVYFNGQLKGSAFGRGFWKNFWLNPDNNINKPVYGMKGREVLAGKDVSVAALPPGLDAYRQALVKYYPK